MKKPLISHIKLWRIKQSRMITQIVWLVKRRCAGILRIVHGKEVGKGMPRFNVFERNPFSARQGYIYLIRNIVKTITL